MQNSIKCGDLHKDRTTYPTPDVIKADEIAKAKVSYSQHGDKFDDATLLAFSARTLRKNLDAAHKTIAELRGF